jgi:F0F1-type ATP synthase delta subunit
MNKKLLKQLIIISYKNGELDNSVISQIVERLTRAQLKNAEKMQNVYIEAPFPIQKDTFDQFDDLFTDKKIVFKENPSLLVGTRITYNDDVFDLSLKNSLDSIIDSIENYD